VIDFADGWILVRVLNAVLGVACVVWLVFLMGVRAEGDGWSTTGRRMMCIGHLMALVIITSAQIRNVHAEQPLNLIAWAVSAMLLLTLVACYKVSHDLLRAHRAQPPP